MMGIERKKLLGQAGVAALVLGLAACSPAGEGEGEGEGASTRHAAQSAGHMDEGEGEGGSDGEGDEGGGAGGGEFGIDPDMARADPVVYLTALEVMRAHYLAGLAAFDEGRRAVGAEMFSHPISEIYVDLEPVIADLGAPDFYDSLLTASQSPYDGSSDDAVRASVDTVLDAIDTAEQFTPQSEQSAAQVQSRVIANMLERGALQYAFAQGSDSPNGPYLDGYGYYMSAQTIFDRHRDAIADMEGGVAEALGAALLAQSEAYATVTAPSPMSADSQRLISLARAATDAVK
ncbi:hypothetical protein V0U79_02245 [Hyphobacterium sp. HN65]|uniref:DUF305 domain-containing protein n=1 Tax=Hyphobacterium lacteum TaxID=3116575 RepID=A0ABU7LML2_9PROT|nr:hypothetical protein [Hyphobacterium sp. HN65]MEE2525170.1 hypothetical protein [Hyphobacterium sp. HN65]